jgi:hypothetical protein
MPILYAFVLCMMGQLSMLNHTIKSGGKSPPPVVGSFEYKGPSPQVGVMGGAQILGIPHFKGLTPPHSRARRLRFNKSDEANQP